MLLSLEHLRTTKKKRRGICPRRIEELRIALEMGEDIPPIRVNAMGDGTFVVKDGRHRIGAHHAAGMTQIWVIVENIMRRLFRWMSAQCARIQLQGSREAVFFICDYRSEASSPCSRKSSAIARVAATGFTPFPTTECT